MHGVEWGRLLQRSTSALLLKRTHQMVGSVRGQFADLLELFRVGGPPPDTNYLFLGGFVGCGRHSVLTAALILGLKVIHRLAMGVDGHGHRCTTFTAQVRYPSRITVVRGSQESTRVSQVRRCQMNHSATHTTHANRMPRRAGARHVRRGGGSVPRLCRRVVLPHRAV